MSEPKTPTPQETTKDIIIAAMQNGYLFKTSGTTVDGIKKANEFNAEEIAKMYKTLFKAVSFPNE